MEFEILGKYQDIALVKTDELLIYDTESALNLIKMVKQGVNCHKFIISKTCVAESFFSTDSLYTVEILQNYVSLHIRIAILGDYSCYEGEKIMSVINGVNKGDRIHFTDDMDSAIKRLEADIGI